MVDDYDVVRDSLTFALESYDDVEIVGEAADGAEAVALCAELQPDVALIDLKMPHMDGAEAAQIILEEHPEICVIILTSGVSSALIQAAIEAGAAGVILKDATAEDIYLAIQALCAD